LGASTTEAQEGVSTEVAEAVVDALQGKLAATAVNAPMVSPEVLKELAPYVTLAEALGKVRRDLDGRLGCFTSKDGVKQLLSGL
jgi:D-3-phosphoglycerate dehydrogenase